MKIIIPWMYVFLLLSAIATAQEPIQGSIVYSNNADSYDSLAWYDGKWLSCSIDSDIPPGLVFGEDDPRTAGSPAHSYLCYNKENIERIAECIGDDTQSYSQTAVGGEWHVSGGKVTTQGTAYYCCNDEWWNTDLDNCVDGSPNSACELNGYKVAKGGENVVFGSYRTYQFIGESASGPEVPDTENMRCCEDQSDEFYVTSNCETSTSFSKCCNSPDDKIDNNGLCVSECCTAKETDKSDGCTNGKDDDCDGLIDCQDPDCRGKTGTNGQGICCQNDDKLTADCASFSIGSCGSYSCKTTDNTATTNRCDVIETKSRCSTVGKCGAFQDSCTKKSDGSFECDQRVDNTLCKTNNEEDCNLFCDTDYECKQMTQYPGVGGCWLKYSDCKKSAEDSLAYTMPNDINECPCHRPYSNCKTDQSKLISTIGGAICPLMPSGG